VRIRVPGVNTIRKRLATGEIVIYYYHRATGNRIDGTPGSAEFVASYAAAETKLKSRLSGDTFNGLIRAYTSSIEFETKLSAASQREYKRMLTKAEAEFGTMPREVLNDPKVRHDFLKWRAEVARGSGEREADNRLSVISAMLTWAVEHGQLHANQIKGFRRLYHSNRSERIWLPEHIQAFMAVAPVELQRALIIALHTGQRQGDILRLAWSSYDGNAIALRQGKSSRGGRLAAMITVPCTLALKRTLDQTPRTSPLILTTKTGLAFKKRYFSQLWEDAAREAGLEDLHFHDLRGTAVTMLSEAGSTPQQIATITGHSLTSVGTILDRYLARTRTLAEQAIVNWENSPRTEFANQLQTIVPPASARKPNQ
jgi:integrase